MWAWLLSLRLLFLLLSLLPQFPSNNSSPPLLLLLPFSPPPPVCRCGSHPDGPPHLPRRPPPTAVEVFRRLDPPQRRQDGLATARPLKGGPHSRRPRGGPRGRKRARDLPQSVANRYAERERKKNKGEGTRWVGMSDKKGPPLSGAAPLESHVQLQRGPKLTCAACWPNALRQWCAQLLSKHER